MKTPNELGTRPIGGLLVKFAAPSIVAMLVMSLYNIVDQLFIGRGVGYHGNAATNIVFPVNVVTIAVSMLIGEGSTALYSIRLGEGRGEEARKCVGNALIMLSLIGVVFAVVCLVFLQPLLGFLGATPVIMPYAVDYAGPIVWGIPFMVVAGGLNALIRANGAPAYAMKSMVSGAVLNTILDPLFIFSFGMGVKGAAIATAISQGASFLVSLHYLSRKNGFGLSRRHFRLSGGVVGKIAATGVPASLSQLAIMVVIVLVNKSLVFYGADSHYGSEIPLAAHGITMKVNQILFAVLLGISMGAQPIIGYNYGAGNISRVKRTFAISAVAAVSVGLIGFVVFFFFPQSIINLFGQEEELYNEFARKCFRTFLFFVYLNGFTVLAGTFFQSMAKVGRAVAIQLARQLLFMVPALHIIPAHMGLVGILYCGPTADSLSFVLALTLVAFEFSRMTRRAVGESRRPEAAESASSTRASARIA